MKPCHCENRNFTWDNEDSEELQRAVGLAKVYSTRRKNNETKNIWDVPIAFCAVRYRPGVQTESYIHAHKLVGFLPAGYYENYSTVQDIKEGEFSKNESISRIFDLVPLEKFIAQITVLNGLEEKTKVLNRGVSSIFEDLQVGCDEGVAVTT